MYHESIPTPALPPASSHTGSNNFSTSPSCPSHQFSLAAWVLRNPIWWSPSLVVSSDTGGQIPLPLSWDGIIYFMISHLFFVPPALSLCWFWFRTHRRCLG